MILSRLRGGIGNQLFQYAAAFRLASMHRTDLKLDISKFDDLSHTTPRRYELGGFDISGEIASATDVARLSRRSNGPFQRWLPSRFRSAESEARTERHFQFDPEVLRLPNDVVLDGYWQSERYFLDVSDRLRSEFSVKAPAVGRNAEVAGEIAATNAVSLHVRRGDYATDPATTAMHGICPIDYYDRAVEFVIERVADPVFFLFSDDPDWVRAHLKIDGAVVVVEHNGSDAGHEDLRLMGLCRHHVIANSTFSWWGAWLNPSSEKIVVAPKQWFGVDSIDTSDLLPADWVTL